MEKAFRGSTSFAATGGKIALEQLLLSPFFIATTIGLNLTLNGVSNSETKQHITRELVPIWTRAVAFWSTVSFLNYSFVALPYRVLFASGASFTWNHYLSCRVAEGHTPKA
jgi:hypothetical protein